MVWVGGCVVGPIGMVFVERVGGLVGNLHEGEQSG